ncbi:LysR family transcriptional regulator [Celeribacter arenosi]|uniref:LysR family transcriptional regulator n=1 Tax=Celeribacter arenosi TaxID=792649 RepID=A0ABP7KEX3_9RHOB
MDRFDEMRIFARVVEARSFRAAARDLGLAPSTVTDAVKKTEARLGTRLLDRTTRMVAPTPDGEAWYRRCLDIVAATEDAEAAFTGAAVSGRVRLDAVGSLARACLVPALPRLLEMHPNLDLMLSEGERLVDLMREGVDIALRTGPAADSDLFRRPLGTLSEATVAAPSYLRAHGTPRDLKDLAGHRMVGFFSTRTQSILPLDFQAPSKVVEVTLPTTLVVTGTETLIEAARAGLGIVQLPRYRVEGDIQAGVLVELLPEFPPTPSPLAAYYARDRQLSPRIRAVLDWLSGIEFPNTE